MKKKAIVITKEMTANEIRERIMSKKAQFACVVYQRECKVKKGAPKITKLSRARNVRIGTPYDSIEAVQKAKGVTNAEDAAKENMGLHNGLVMDTYPYTVFNPMTRRYFLRINTNKNTAFDTEYYVDGKLVQKSEIEDYLYSSEKNHKGDLPPVMNIAMDSIKYIA